MTKHTKGITLIALVITIIVLLILAGVTIVTLTGDNGLLQKAQTAKQKNEAARELELIKLAVTSAQVAGEGRLTTKNLNDELKAKLNNEEIVTESSEYYFYKANNNYRIYKDGKVEVGKLLPDEYQQVEYLKSTGTQWIDSGIKANSMTKIICTGEIDSESIFGARQSLFANAYAFSYSSSNVYRTDYGNSVYEFINNNNLVKNEKIIIEKDGRDTKITTETGNTITYKSNEQNFETPHSLALFALKQDTGVFTGKATIYQFKCYDNNILIRNFIPCYSTTTVTDIDGKQCPKDTIGLYDTVNGQFYENHGTGTFGYGMEDGTYVAPKNN